MKQYTFMEDDGEAVIGYVNAENHDQAVAKAQASNMEVEFSTDFYSETLED
jgi:hypothetical protein